MPHRPARPQSCLLAYSSFLQPDADKDPLTLAALERCQATLLGLCTATGTELRAGERRAPGAGGRGPGGGGTRPA